MCWGRLCRGCSAKVSVCTECWIYRPIRLMFELCWSEVRGLWKLRRPCLEFPPPFYYGSVATWAPAKLSTGRGCRLDALIFSSAIRMALTPGDSAADQPSVDAAPSCSEFCLLWATFPRVAAAEPAPDGIRLPLPFFRAAA